VFYLFLFGKAQSIYFNGTNHYIEISASIDLNPGGFTILAWIKPLPFDNDCKTIISNHDDNFGSGYEISLNTYN